MKTGGGEEVPNREDKTVTEFLKDAVAYLENRIGMLDTKASILIAVQALVFAVLAYTMGEVFLKERCVLMRIGSCISLGVAFVLFTATVFLLLQTVRPSKSCLGLHAGLCKMKVCNYVMWFVDDKDEDFPTSPHEYRERIRKLNRSQIKANYEKTHYTLLQLVRRKYRSYRWAVRCMKFLVLWSALSIAGLALLKCLITLCALM